MIRLLNQWGFTTVTKDKCPDNIALSMSKLEFPDKFVCGFIDYEYESRFWLKKIFTKPLSMDKARVILWKTAHNIR